jgi:thiol-disulfide isomerase/thioredoxin
MITIETEEDFQKITEGLTVVAFSAPWCAKCKAILPKFERLSASINSAAFIKVDTSKLSDLSTKLDIRGLPTFMVFDNQKVVDRIFGNEFSDVEAMIKRHVMEKPPRTVSMTSAPPTGITVKDIVIKIAETVVPPPSLDFISLSNVQVPTGPMILNVATYPGGYYARPPPPPSSSTATGLAGEIQESILTLYADYLTPDGKGVDYEGLKASPKFAKYVELTSQLQVG